MRKKVIRSMAYVYVFFVVLARRFNIVWKRRLAAGSCAVVMAIALCISYFGQPVEREIEGQQRVAERTVRSHNKVLNTDTMASIEINQATVEQNVTDRTAVNVVRTGERGSLEQGTGRNQIVKNPVALSEIRALYENYGTRPDSVGENIRYQYPVEMGYPVDYNYDGKQTAADYVCKDIFETISEEQDTTEEQTTESTEQDTTEELTTESAVQDKTEELTTESTAQGTSNAATIEVTTERADTGNAETNEDTTEDATEPAVTQRSSEEQMETENFRKNVWNVIMPTTPVEKNLSDQEKRESSKTDEKSVQETTEKKDDISETGDTIEESKSTDTHETTQEQDTSLTIADASYFTVHGKLRAGVDAFVGDITITPTGRNGYNRLRIGEDGEFGSSVVLTKDGIDQKVTLYFTNGTDVTSGVEYTYSKDVTAPTLAFSEEGLTKIEGKDKSIYCTNNPKIAVVPKDNMDEQGQMGIDKICYVHGDKLTYVVEHFEEACLQVEDDFYGRVLANCSDKGGNTSDVVSKFYLVEQNAPVITMVEDELCTAPYTLWVDVADTGAIVSGINRISCVVNGQEYPINNADILENTMIDDGITVPSRYEFSVPFTEEGTYEVTINVTDNAGNTSSMTRTVQVTRPELVSVYMPETFTVHIDPQQLAGKEQIYSDDITLHNNSEFGVKVTIKSVELVVKDEVSDAGVKKDADIYLIAPDTGEKLLLKKGLNKQVYSYTLPQGAEGDIADLKFVGSTTEGSDAMWKDSDISIQVQLQFEK